MTYRDDLAALAARHAALEAEVAHKTQELEQAGRLLDEARERIRLPVLANLRVATPCSAEWAAMVGDERTRACRDCNKQVYNLSGMTRDEAEALIVEKEGRLCVRYFQRADGTILLADCEVGVARKRRRRIVAAGAVALLAGGGALGYHAMQLGNEQVLGGVTFDDEVQPRVEYRLVQGVEPPPAQLEVEVVRPTAPPPQDERIYEVLGGVSADPEPAPLSPTTIDPTIDPTIDRK